MQAIPAGSLTNNLSISSLDSTVRLGTTLPGVSLSNLDISDGVDLTVESVDNLQTLTFTGTTVLHADGSSFTQIGRAIVSLGLVTQTTPAGIRENGDGILVLTTTNAYSGLTDIQAGVIEMRHIDSKEQLGDIFTKPLTHDNFVHARKQIMGW